MEKTSRSRETGWKIPFLTFIKTKGYPFWYIKNIIRAGKKGGFRFGNKDNFFFLKNQKNILQQLKCEIMRIDPDFNILDQSLYSFFKPLLMRPKTEAILIVGRSGKPHNGTRGSKKRIIKRHYVPRTYKKGFIKDKSHNVVFKTNLSLLESNRINSLYNLKSSLSNNNIFVVQLLFNVFFQFYVHQIHIKQDQQKRKIKTFKGFLLEFLKTDNTNIFIEGSNNSLLKYYSNLYDISYNIKLWNFVYQEDARLSKTNVFYNYLLPFHLLKKNNGRTLKSVLDDNDSFAIFIQYFNENFKWLHFSTFLPNIIKIFSNYNPGGGLRTNIKINYPRLSPLLGGDIAICQQIIKDSGFLKIVFFLLHNDPKSWFSRASYRQRIKYLVRQEIRFQQNRSKNTLEFLKLLLSTSKNNIISVDKKKKLRYFLSKKDQLRACKKLYKLFNPFVNKSFKERLEKSNAIKFYKLYTKYVKVFKILNKKYKLKKKIKKKGYTYFNLKQLLNATDLTYLCDFLTIEWVRQEAIVRGRKAQMARLDLKHQRVYIDFLNTILSLKKPKKKKNGKKNKSK